MSATNAANGHRNYVTGALLPDLPQIENDLAGTGTADADATRRAQVQALMLHELGHVMGLGHVTDPTQLMYPELNPTVTDFGAGDRRGLAVPASGRCAPDL